MVAGRQKCNPLVNDAPRHKQIVEHSIHGKQGNAIANNIIPSRFLRPNREKKFESIFTKAPPLIHFPHKFLYTI